MVPSGDETAKRYVMLQNFKVGDYVIYPGRGLAQVKTIGSAKTCSGISRFFYTLEVAGNRNLLNISFEKASKLRRCGSFEEYEKALQIVKQRRSNLESISFKTLSDKVNNGDLYELAEVIRDLKSFQFERILSYEEVELLERASGLLRSEMLATLPYSRLVALNVEGALRA